MTTSDQPTVRAALAAAITRAMKQRDRAATAVYRSALGAIGNAEAVDVGVRAGAIESAPTGVGAAEVARRVLTEQDMVRVVVAEADERTAAAASLEPVDAERAAALRLEAGLLVDLVRDLGA